MNDELIKGIEEVLALQKYMQHKLEKLIIIAYKKPEENHQADAAPYQISERVQKSMGQATESMNRRMSEELRKANEQLIPPTWPYPGGPKGIWKNPHECQGCDK